jgi:phosphoglycolate phosphatase
VNVLLDLDGTLTDPREGIVGCIRHALIQLGESLPPDSELEKFIGPPLHDVFRQLTSGNSDQVEAAVTAYRARFEAIGMYENQVYPGIPNALKELAQRGARLFLATSKPRVFAERILKHFDLSNGFVRIYGSELDGSRGDKSELIAHILDDANLNRAHTVMVGDRSYDVLGAVTNQVHPVGVLWGYGSRKELQDAGAKQLYEHPKELVQLVA